MRKITLKEMKEIEVNILKYIDDICKENNISYFAVGGTLLGAIRHDGFIPWDDDIDICLKREDYYKLVKMLNSMNGRYKIIDASIGSGTYFPFAKLIDTKTIMHELLLASNIEEYGVYVDIFAIDKLPDNKNKIHKQFNHIRRYHKIFLSSAILNEPPSKRLVKRILRRLTMFWCKNIIGIKRIVNKYIKICEKYNYIENPKYYLCCWPSYSEEHEIIEAKNIEKTIRHKFENIEINIPEKYDEYLTTLFGDYMKLPPKEERVSHHYFEAYWKD